jgi:hypothetical protein
MAAVYPASLAGGEEERRAAAAKLSGPSMAAMLPGERRRGGAPADGQCGWSGPQPGGEQCPSNRSACIPSHLFGAPPPLALGPPAVAEMKQLMQDRLVGIAAQLLLMARGGGGEGERDPPPPWYSPRLLVRAVRSLARMGEGDGDGAAAQRAQQALLDKVGPQLGSPGWPRHACHVNVPLRPSLWALHRNSLAPEVPFCRGSRTPAPCPPPLLPPAAAGRGQPGRHPAGHALAAGAGGPPAPPGPGAVPAGRAGSAAGGAGLRGRHAALRGHHPAAPAARQVGACLARWGWGGGAQRAARSLCAARTCGGSAVAMPPCPARACSLTVLPPLPAPPAASSRTTAAPSCPPSSPAPWPSPPPATWRRWARCCLPCCPRWGRGWRRSTRRGRPRTPPQPGPCWSWLSS